MDIKNKGLFFCVIVLFLLLNSFLLWADLPNIFYPVTALSMVCFLVLQWPKKEKKNHIDTENLLTSTVPRERLMNELAMAKRVQEGLLSIESPEIPGIRIAKKCIPAKSVGGDFYTFISQEFNSLSPKKKQVGIVEYFDQHDSYLGLAIGDVAGHGVSSALIMALSSGLLSEIGKHHKSPAKTLSQTNQDLLRYIQNSQISHVTVFYALLNTRSKTLLYAKGGHPGAILIRKDKTMETLDSKGVFLGMFQNESYQEKEIKLHTGDRVYFYTDGITETKNPKGDLFGEDRFTDFLITHHKEPIGILLNLVFEELDRFSNYQPAKDDRSLVILEIE